MGQVWVYGTISADVQQNTSAKKILIWWKTWKSVSQEEEEEVSADFFAGQ